VRSWIPAGLLLSSVAGAQQFSGPSETRAPRNAEAIALSKAVCESKIWLGPLSGCTVFTYPGSSTPEVRGKKLRFIPTAVLFGSFSAPNTREVLAQFCTETESCLSDAVLLRRDGRSWKALGYVQGFDLGRCLTYPTRPGQSAATCLGSEDLGTASLRVASWRTGRLNIQTFARFGLLRFAPQASEQCRTGYQVEPALWEDGDRNADGMPDLTLTVFLASVELAGRPCDQVSQGPELPRKSTRIDLPFYWTGATLVPAAATRQFIRRYSLDLSRINRDGGKP
jgi:hypothetical protein